MLKPGRLSYSLSHLCLFVTTAVLLGMAELSPRRFALAMQEDGWAEWATFAAFVGAACVAALGVRRARRWDLARVALLGLGAFALFVAGEEISWGQRILGFRPPALFLARNYQQESNLHNLLKDIVDTRWMVFVIAAGYGVVAPYVAYVTRLPRALAPEITLLPWFALVAWLELSYPYELVGELAELLLGLSFLVDVVGRTADVELRMPRARPVPRDALYPIVALAAGVLLSPLNVLALRLQDTELVAHTEAELTRLAAHLAESGVLRAKLFERSEVHKRLYTAVKAGYLELDPAQFYLDAWNSPYWIAFERLDAGRGALHVYSFGPNRRRDSEGDGDDVGRRFEVSAPATAEGGLEHSR
ncbi:MAG: hypothetical protein ABW252_16550 [Polyangiales bacterium]